MLADGAAGAALTATARFVHCAQHGARLKRSATALHYYACLGAGRQPYSGRREQGACAPATMEVAAPPGIVSAIHAQLVEVNATQVDAFADLVADHLAALHRARELQARGGGC